ncbi:DUF1120 domain-containing protein [Cronobacter sakazakii]|uniref:DUF1120 domain-containing protein n=1 Tax=Cronobacter sakazakii TaxID=28141 RepID=UPI000CFB1CE8|nr:DUF1120 domain-containing protein [Cronobacter sakazakii]ELY6086816.1 DUF1120 domain-containing protein [Cronobacter sakazakii]
MFNKTLLIGAGLMAMVSAAHATDSTDLKVTGKLINGSCTPSLENGGVVDFGNIPLGNLNTTQTNQLGTKTTHLSIQCTNAMQVAWVIADNHNDSVASLDISDAQGTVTQANQKFGLGKTLDNINLGAWFVRVSGVQQYDGINGDTLYIDGIQNYVPDSAWATTTSGVPYNDGSRGYTLGEKGTKEPAAATLFSYTLNISAAIQGTDTLAISDKTNLDGAATISLVYL